MTPRTLHIISASIIASGVIVTSAASIPTHGMPAWATAFLAGVVAVAGLVNHIGSAIWPVLSAENIANMPLPPVSTTGATPAPPFNQPLSNTPPVAGPFNPSKPQ